jgi:hypothetical protein
LRIFCQRRRLKLLARQAVPFGDGKTRPRPLDRPSICCERSASAAFGAEDDLPVSARRLGSLLRLPSVDLLGDHDALLPFGEVYVRPPEAV